MIIEIRPDEVQVVIENEEEVQLLFSHDGVYLDVGLDESLAARLYFALGKALESVAVVIKEKTELGENHDK